MGNGCVVHWDKVPDICWHVMLWLVSNNVVSLPPKWSAATIAGPSVRGRDRHYVDGSALLRGPPSTRLLKLRGVRSTCMWEAYCERERERKDIVCARVQTLCVSDFRHCV